MKMRNHKVGLLPFEPSDAYIISDWYYSGEYPFYFRSLSSVVKITDFQNFDHLLGGSTFIVRDELKKEPVGMVGIHGVNTLSMTCKFMALSDVKYRGKEYIKEATSLVFNWLFKELNYNRVYSDVCEKDERTLYVVKKSGMKCLGPVDLCKVSGKLYEEIRYYMDNTTYLERY